MKFEERTVTFHPRNPSIPSITSTEKKQLKSGRTTHRISRNTSVRVITIKIKTPKPKTPKPKDKKIVVADTSLIDILYKDIKDTIKVSVTKKRIQELLTNFGEQEIRKYISNWESFKDIDKKTVSGYFVDAVKNSYDIPVKEVKQHNKSDYGKHTEFEQRTYSDDFYESLYENSDVKTG